MHRYRRAANYSAWYDDPSDEPVLLRNPFAKRRPRTARSDEDELDRMEGGHGTASRLRPIRTDGDHRTHAPLGEKPQSEYLGPVQSVTDPVPHTRLSLSLRSERPIIEEVPPAVDAHADAIVDAPSVMWSVKTKHDPIVRHDPLMTDSSLVEDEYLRRRWFKGPSLFHMMKRDATAKKNESDNSNPPKKRFTPLSQVKATLLRSWFNIFLPVVPVGFYIKYTNSSPVTTFSVNFVAILPLGLMISTCTEELILRLSGFKSMAVVVAFGNAVQLIVTIVALVQNQTLLVRTSLIGQIITNLSLMIGSSFFLGGFNRLEQRFNISLCIVNLDFHFLMILALAIPTAYHAFAANADQEAILRISRGTAILMIFSYCLLLFWCFKTHSAVVETPYGKSARYERWALQTVFERLAQARKSFWRKTSSSPIASIASGASEHGSRHDKDTSENDDDDDDEEEEEHAEPQLSINTIILTLILSTIFMGFCTTFAVDSIQGLTKNTKLSQMFVGLILLPILGCNIDAIRFAQKDNMDESLDITIGGSIQIMGLILPMAVLIDWGRKDPAMTLLFDNFQVVSVACLAILVRYMAQDGKSNWFEGAMLMIFYAIVAVNAWYRPEHVLT